MKTILLTLGLLASFALQSWGQGVVSAQQLPAIEISAPEKAAYGSMIVATAKYDRTQMPKDLAQMRYQWMVLQDGVPTEGFIVWPDGSKVIFGAGITQSKFTIILNVGCHFVTKEKLKVVDPNDEKKISDREVITKADIAYTDPIVFTTEVGGPKPPPPPNPDPPTPPTPGPTPVFPPGQFGLAQFSYDNLMADANMNAQEKTKLAAALSANLKGIAAQIAALSTYRDVVQILADTKAKNNEAFTKSGVPLEKTLAFKKALGDKIYQFYHTDKKLNTATDFQAAWQEIALGLEAIPGVKQKLR